MSGLGTFQPQGSLSPWCDFSLADNIKSLKGRDETECRPTNSLMIVDKLQI